MYSMVSTQPDISYAISLLSRFMGNLGKGHWTTMKWLIRYLIGTSRTDLIYEKVGSKVWLDGYVDSDHVMDKDKRRSITSYYFTLNGCCIS